jgi:hypothetical protein
MPTACASRSSPSSAAPRWRSPRRWLRPGRRTGRRVSAASCSSSKLVVWLPNGQGSGAAGSVYYKLRITNLGTAACTLSGYPTVRALDLAGKPIGKPASLEAGKNAGLVKLAPGGSASFQLRVIEPGDFSPSDCHLAQAAALRVSPRAPAARRWCRSRSKPAPSRPRRCSPPSRSPRASRPRVPPGIPARAASAPAPSTLLRSVPRGRPGGSGRAGPGPRGSRRSARS